MRSCISYFIFSSHISFKMASLFVPEEHNSFLLPWKTSCSYNAMLPVLGSLLKVMYGGCVHPSSARLTNYSWFWLSSYTPPPPTTTTSVQFSPRNKLNTACLSCLDIDSLTGFVVGWNCYRTLCVFVCWQPHDERLVKGIRTGTQAPPHQPRRAHIVIYSLDLRYYTLVQWQNLHNWIINVLPWVVCLSG